MIPLFASVLLACATIPDTTLSMLGRDVSTMRVQGTFSSYGQQSFSGLPFTAIMDSNESFRLSISGPFGMTAARMWAERDTFVYVNYLMQEVHEGLMDSPKLNQALPFPLPASDLMSLMRGRTPGNPERFERGQPRTDGMVLFSCKDTSGVEYMLVDTAAHCIKQYQRKNTQGDILLDVAFTDVHKAEGVNLAHAIDISVEDRKQGASFKLTSVEINSPITERMSVDIPPSFARTSYR